MMWFLDYGIIIQIQSDLLYRKFACCGNFSKFISSSPVFPRRGTVVEAFEERLPGAGS